MLLDPAPKETLLTHSLTGSTKSVLHKIPVMYATMEAYPLSWIYYLTFIFLTAFVFLNMMIGAILEVMSEEQNAKQAQKAHDERDEIARQLQAVQEQLKELTKQVSEKR